MTTTPTETRHVTVQVCTKESRTLVAHTLEGVEWAAEEQKLDKLQSARALMKFEQDHEVVTFTQAADRSSLEGNGGFGVFETTLPGMLEPYWKRLGLEPFSANLLPMLKFHRQVSPVGILLRLDYTAETGQLAVQYCAEIYNFVGRKFATEDEYTEAGIKKTTERVCDILFRSISTPEFLPVGDGSLYRRNTSYGRYQPPRFDKIPDSEDILKGLKAHR